MLRPACRRLFQVLCVMSLLVCGVSLVLWVGSYRVPWTLAAWPRRIVVGQGQDLHRIDSRRGQLTYTREAVYLFSNEKPAWYPRQDLPRPRWELLPSFLNRVGFIWQYRTHVEVSMLMPDERPPIHLYWTISLPYWFLVLLTGFLPALWARSAMRLHVRRRRERAGLCLCCGYDLRASKDRCPECGTPIAAKATG